jgi:hypothetical protein
MDTILVWMPDKDSTWVAPFFIFIVVPFFIWFFCFVKDNREKKKKRSEEEKKRSEEEKKRSDEVVLFRSLMLENQNLRRRLGWTPNEEQDDMFSNNALTNGARNLTKQIKDIKWRNAGLRHDIKILNIEDKETLLKAKALLLYLTTSEKQTPQFIEGVQKTLKVITILENSVR